MTAEKKIAWVAGSIVFLLFVIQLIYVNEWAATWDQADFTMALDRFDLLAMQPHFPGYPYFILGGTIVHLLSKEGAGALTLFNTMAYASAFLPIFWLFRRFLSVRMSIIAAVLMYSAPFPLLIVNQPMSEGAAVACLWWFVWSIQKALETDKRFMQLLPLGLFSILLGIRLSYLLLGIGVLYLWFMKWKRGRLSLHQLAAYVAAALFFQLIWVAALVYSEGGLTAFIKLALAFTDGHFNEWGNTALSDTQPLWKRAYLLFIQNGIWTGILMQKALLTCLFICLVPFLWKNMRYRKTDMDCLLLLLGVFYSLWALFAQNIEKPRHFLPVILISLFLFFRYVLLRSTKGLLLLVSALFIAQSSYAVSVIKEQAETLPASYQLSAYFNQEKAYPVIYTWEEGRVLEYLKTPVLNKEIQTYEYFLQDQSNYQNRPVYITEKVVEGFKAQGHDISSRLTEIKVFESNPLFDPVYSRIVLYRWTSDNEE